MTAASQAIPVVVHGGWSWTTTVSLIGILVQICGAGALVAWVKSRPKMRELEKDAEEKLRDDLIARVEKLERKLEEKEAQHAAEMSIMRHRVNNSDQCLDALLMLLEQSPDKVMEAVSMIKAMRDRHRATEALEKGSIRGAAIAAKTLPGEAGTT